MELNKKDLKQLEFLYNKKMFLLCRGILGGLKVRNVKKRYLEIDEIARDLQFNVFEEYKRDTWEIIRGGIAEEIEDCKERNELLEHRTYLDEDELSNVRKNQESFRKVMYYLEEDCNEG